MIGTLTVIAAIAFSVSGICQIRTTLKQQSARGVSLGFTTLLAVGVFALWLAVIIDNANSFIIIERSINAAIMATVQVVVSWFKYKDALYDRQHVNKRNPVR